MPTQDALLGVGMPPSQAGALGNTPAAVAGAGTTQATAAAIRINNHAPLVTGASSNTGAILPADALIGTPYYVSSVGATAAKIYAPVGHTLNGVASATGLTFSAAGMAVFMRTGTTTWVCSGSATLS